MSDTVPQSAVACPVPYHNDNIRIADMKHKRHVGQNRTVEMMPNSLLSKA